MFNVIYFCQIPSAWVCQEQFENIYQQMQFRAKHRNPMKCKIQIQASSILHQKSECSLVCFRQIRFVTFQTLFTGDQPQCRSMEMIRLFVIFGMKDVKKR